MNKRIGDLEFRWKETDSDFPLDDDCPEIVRWQYRPSLKREYCYTLALWINEIEGYDLRFIGNTPFSDNVDKDIFWELAKYGQKIVDATFELEWIKENESIT